jgi:hypothetical protein
MSKDVVAALCIATLPFAATSASAQTCTKPCPSHQCAEQCYKGDCESYCVRDVGPVIASRQPGKFTLTVPNASPELAEKIRRAIEDQ